MLSGVVTENVSLYYFNLPDGMKSIMTGWVNHHSMIYMCRSNVKRCKERNLEEASQLLRRISKNLLESLEIKYMLPLIQLIITMQLETLQVSTVFRKLDQVVAYSLWDKCVQKQ